MNHDTDFKCYSFLTKGVVFEMEYFPDISLEKAKFFGGWGEGMVVLCSKEFEKNPMEAF